MADIDHGEFFNLIEKKQELSYTPLIIAPAGGTWCFRHVLGASGPYLRPSAQNIICTVGTDSTLCDVDGSWLQTWRIGSFLTSCIIMVCDS